MALGLNIIVGFAGLLDLGYVAFFAIGAYTAAYFGSGFWDNAGWDRPPCGRHRGQRARNPRQLPLDPRARHRRDRAAGALIGVPTLRLHGPTSRL